MSKENLFEQNAITTIAPYTAGTKIFNKKDYDVKMMTEAGERIVLLRPKTAPEKPILNGNNGIDKEELKL